MVPGVNGSVGSIRCFESNPDDLALTGLKLVSRIFASWNHLDGWLPQIERLRAAA
jgi:hypothetical protein